MSRIVFFCLFFFLACSGDRSTKPGRPDNQSGATATLMGKWRVVSYDASQNPNAQNPSFVYMMNSEKDCVWNFAAGNQLMKTYKPNEPPLSGSYSWNPSTKEVGIKINFVKGNANEIYYMVPELTDKRLVLENQHLKIKLFLERIP